MSDWSSRDRSDDDLGRDQLIGPQDRGPIRAPRGMQLVAVLAAVLIGCAALLSTLRNAGPERPQSLVPERDRGTTVSLDVAGIVCTATDHRRTLTVSFRLLNSGDVPVTVFAIRSDNPLGGLRQVATALSGGTCQHQTESRSLPYHLEVGATTVVGLDFLVPAACPWPLPVQAVAWLQNSRAQRFHEQLLVLTDLGGIRFDQCPGASEGQVSRRSVSTAATTSSAAM